MAKDVACLRFYTKSFENEFENVYWDQYIFWSRLGPFGTLWGLFLAYLKRD